MVEEIGLDEWRLRRVHRAELGALRSQMLSAEVSGVQDEINRAFADTPGFLPQILEKSTIGIAYQWEAVVDALDELETRGTVSADTCDYLATVLGREADCPRMLKGWLLGEIPEGEEEDFKIDELPSTADDGKPGMREVAAHMLLETTLKTLNRQERELRKKERTELEIARQWRSIPFGSELDRIQRYENSIKRDMYRAMDRTPSFCSAGAAASRRRRLST